jgi:uncharacterized peroxidase-related enzyme
MFLSAPPEDEAVRAIYDEARSEDGYVMNLLRVWSWHPEVHRAFTALRSLLSSQTTLSPREIAVLNATTASRRNDSYCSIAWGTRVAKLSDAETAAALLRRHETPSLSARERALIGWVNAVVADPNATTFENVEALRNAGFSDREVFDATAIVALRLAFGTVNDALGARPDRELAREAPPQVLASVSFGRAVE